MVIKKGFFGRPLFLAAVASAVLLTGCFERSKSGPSQVPAPDSRDAFNGVTIHLNPEIEFFADGRFRADDAGTVFRGNFLYVPGSNPRILLFPDGNNRKDAEIELSYFRGSAAAITRFAYTITRAGEEFSVPQSGDASVIGGVLVPGRAKDDSNGHDFDGLAPDEIGGSFLTKVVQESPDQDRLNEEMTVNLRTDGSYQKVNSPPSGIYYDYERTAGNVGEISFTQIESGEPREVTIALTFTSESGGTFRRVERFQVNNLPTQFVESGTFSIAFY